MLKNQCTTATTRYDLAYVTDQSIRRLEHSTMLPSFDRTVSAAAMQRLLPVGFERCTSVVARQAVVEQADLHCNG